MAAIKPLSDSADKFVRRAAVATEDYRDGVLNPRRSWQDATAAAEQSYKAGVIAAANAGRFGSGVRRAGDEKWQRGATTKGPGRFAEGVAVARDDWSDGFAPYHEAIERLTLPPRGPRGSEANYQRVRAIGAAERAVYERLHGG